MRSMKIWLVALLTALLGFAGGYFFYANTVARYDVTSSVCTTMQEAVQSQMLTIAQVKELGSKAGSTLHRDYGSVASKLRIPDESARLASPESVCSQFLVGVNQSR